MVYLIYNVVLVLGEQQSDLRIHIYMYICMLLLLSRFSHVRLCVTPETAAHQAPLKPPIWVEMTDTLGAMPPASLYYIVAFPCVQ